MKTRCVALFGCCIVWPSLVCAAGDPWRSGQSGKWWEKGKTQVTQCVGSHYLKTCSRGVCSPPTACPKGKYCIEPSTLPSLKAPQCVQPDAIVKTGCAGPKTQSIEVSVQGPPLQKVVLLDACPARKPQCILGACVDTDEVVCKDSDATNYAILQKWAQAGTKAELQADASILKAGTVTMGTAAGPLQDYPDKCKSGMPVLYEQACANGVAKEVAINCADPLLGGACKLSAEEIGRCVVDLAQLQDTDNDTIPDLFDNCLKVPNMEQLDVDKDGVADKCDNCPKSENFDQLDGDKDGVGDKCDNCPAVINVNQVDTDQDGKGDDCDNCPTVTNPLQTDMDTNGRGDACQFTTLAAGDYHTCALLQDSTVRCWGDNFQGQLGDGTTKDKLTPTLVNDLTGATALAAGSEHTCALLQDSTVQCWGWNLYGELGDGTTEDKLTPTLVEDLTGATALAAGHHHTRALFQDSTVRCWGNNFHGQLGDGTKKNKLTPTLVKDLTGATALAARDYHTCALCQDSTVRCWGWNLYEEPGDGMQASKSTLAPVNGLAGNVTALAVGDHHTCALLQDGTVRCWGNNLLGQLGDGTTEKKLTPTLVKNLTGATAPATGVYHTCALLQDGTVRCWGNNIFGQLGDGKTEDSLVPVPVKF